MLLSKNFTDSTVWNFLETYYEGRINHNELTEGNYEITKCLNCGFIWQAYILNDEGMKKLYDTWTSSEDSLKKKKCADFFLYSKYAHQVQMISLLLNKNPYQIDVLDFGMGWGYWCSMAQAYGYNVSGFEVSEQRIEFASKRGINIINSLDGDIVTKFDFIYSNQVFEHISNPLQTLKLLVSLLKDEGIVCISVPNGKGIEQQIAKPEWQASKDAIHPLEHINCFSRQTIVKLGESAGLKLMRQPFPLTSKRNLKLYMKRIVGKRYTHKHDITLYFRKYQSCSNTNI